MGGCDPEDSWMLGCVLRTAASVGHRNLNLNIWTNQIACSPAHKMGSSQYVSIRGYAVRALLYMGCSYATRCLYVV